MSNENSVLVIVANTFRKKFKKHLWEVYFKQVFLKIPKNEVKFIHVSREKTSFYKIKISHNKFIWN